MPSTSADNAKCNCCLLYGTRLLNSRKTAGYWNTISTSDSQKYNFSAKQTKLDTSLCRPLALSYLRGFWSNLDSSCTPVFLSGVFVDRTVCRHILAWDYHISSVWSWCLVYRSDHNDSTHPTLILRHSLRNRIKHR